MVYIIVKRTGVKWKQGQISTTCEGDCFIEHQIIKTNKMRNVWQTEKFIWKSCEWKGQLISTQSLLYIINAYWQNLKTSVLPDAVLVNFNWMSKKTSWKVSLRKAGPLTYIRSAWFLTLDVILWERQPRKEEAKTFGQLHLDKKDKMDKMDN